MDSMIVTVESYLRDCILNGNFTTGEEVKSKLLTLKVPQPTKPRLSGKKLRKNSSEGIIWNQK
jgi:hypothetical protein